MLFDIDQAVLYNLRYSTQYPHPNDDTLSRSSRAFAERVRDQQLSLGTYADGKYGPHTHSLLYPPPQKHYVYRDRQRIPLPLSTLYTVSHEHSLAEVGHFSPRKNTKPRRLIWHWGGLNPEHLVMVMSGPRKVSTHFAIGLSQAHTATVYQLLDISHRAWHAGRHNRGAIGIDICQQADPRYIQYYIDHNYIVELRANPGVGPSQAITLDPRILAACRDFSAHLRAAMNITEQTSHHLLSSRKWDISPWWEAINE